ncbi:DUF4241 domain-containing protein [Nannocystis punicea]|uniref:DUF4241 domain-containing protein n=1 Tax=Nannocystis punicea TaxID=2995304 RepID=A0ABY7H748_9BACT|nr:DUF4241 domain-containing protein [Nannocystis poenicansa]WAS94910.1 DUF4241 domain-containing protein [Nannocystis poenicansa]
MLHSPFTAAFTPGTRFAQERGELVEVGTRVVGELKVPSGRIVVADPLTTSFDEPGGPLTLAAPRGVFPVEVALARFEDGDVRVACARVRFESSAPAVRWEVAVFEGEKPPVGDAIPGYGVDAGMGCFFDEQARGVVDEATSEAWLAAMEEKAVDTWTWHTAEVGAANVVMFSSGWGDGFYGSWWGFDAGGRLVELVTDFEVLLGPRCERFELPLPLPRGRVRHPLLEEHDVTMRAPLLSRTAVILGGKGRARVELSDGSPVQMKRKGEARHYSWEKTPPGARLVVAVIVGLEPLDVV